MPSYDLLMLFVLGGLTVYGYYKGMAWQIAYLASFLVSYFVATRFDDRLAPLFGDSAPWNKLFALGAIYVATSFGVWMLFRVVRSGIDNVKLQSFDRQMGAFVGAARGAVWCLGITFVALTFVSQVIPSVRQQIIHSRSGKYIARFIDESHTLFPEEVHQVIGPYLQQIDQGLDPNQPSPQGMPGFAGGGGSTAPPSAGPPSTGPGLLDSLPGQVGDLQQRLRDIGVSLGGSGSGSGAAGQGVAAPGKSPGTTPAWPAGNGGTPAWPAAQTSGRPVSNGWPAPPPGVGF